MRGVAPAPTGQFIVFPQHLSAHLPEDNTRRYILLVRVRTAHLMGPASSSLQELNVLDPEFILAVGEGELKTALHTTNEDSVFF